MAVAVAVAVAVSGGGAVAVAGLTKRFFNHIQKDFLINVWALDAFRSVWTCSTRFACFGVVRSVCLHFAPDHVQKFRLTRKGHLCAFAWIQGNAARWRVEFEHIF